MPLFEQVAVLREVDLHYKWSPFCTSSMTIKDLDKLDTVGWAVVGLPQYGLARDGCFRAFGCDCIMEDGNFFLVGQGVEDRQDNVPYDEPFFLENMEGIEIPDPPTRLGSGRMTIRRFSAVVHVMSPTLVRTRIVANVDPNLAFIPQSLIDFVMRKMCGVVFARLQHAAKKAAADPVRNPHARRMRQNEAFYKEWLMPKFQSYCDHMGWEMPPVAAFSLTEEQMQQAARLNENHSTPYVRSLTSMESIESAPSINGDELHPSASAPDLHVHNALSDSTDVGEDNQCLSDSTSAISSISGGTSTKSMLFRDNPITQYLKELEERTQREKARRIEEGRQIMAEQLRPRSLSQDHFERLQELKQAKARRQHKKGAPPSNSTAADETTGVEIISFADRFHSHGRTTRFIIIFTLGLALLVTLYSDRLLGFHSKLRIHADSIWMNLLLDAATFLYLGVSAAVFFVMSYVALVYAFDSLNIGTKSGKRSKQFYGETISFLVAGASGAIVALSVGKAVAGVWLRVGLWYTSQASQWVRNEMENGFNDQQSLAWFHDNVPKSILSLYATALSHVSPLVRGFLSTGLSFVMFVQHWFVVIVIRSNFVGRILAALTLRAFSVLSYMATSWEKYVAYALDMYTDDDITLASWRGAAIDTARPLLVYAAVFLLSLLVLFNATARMESTKKDTKRVVDDDAIAVTVTSDYVPTEAAMAATSTVPPDARRYREQAVSSISMQEDIIPEGDEDMNVSVTQSCVTDMAGTTDTAQYGKNRFRLRLLKKKKNRLADESSVHSSVTETSTKMKRLETY